MKNIQLFVSRQANFELDTISCINLHDNQRFRAFTELVMKIIFLDSLESQLNHMCNILLKIIFLTISTTST